MWRLAYLIAWVGLVHATLVAHCVVGQSRGFPVRGVAESIRDNGMTALGGEPYTFLHIGVEQERDLWMTREASRLLPNVVSSNIDMDRALTLEEEAPYRNAALACPGEGLLGWDHPRSYPRRFLSQYLRIQRCYETVLAYEQSHQIKFDWVVRWRPDELLSVPQRPLSELSPSAVTVWDGCGVLDHAAFAPRHLSDAYFYAAEEVRACRPLRAYTDGCHQPLMVFYEQDAPPECILSARLAGLGVAVHRYPTPICMISATGGYRDHRCDKVHLRETCFKYPGCTIIK